MRSNPGTSFRLPVSSLLGSRFGNFIRASVTYGRGINRPLKYLLSLIICLILELFRISEVVIYHIRKRSTGNMPDPVFIIGFWRSGTTLMHQMLSQDRRFTFVSTYQTIFPDLMYYNKPLRWLAKFLMPQRRPVDNLKLAMDDPQEEEIALANLEVRSFYHFLYFPQSYYKVKKLSLQMEGMTPGELKRWQRSYMKIIRKSTLNRGGDQLLSKNPSNIFRIRILRKMFPDAKFIYLYRDPYKTLTSYSLFFYEIIEGVGFQKISMEQLYNCTEDLFRASYQTFKENKDEIPARNLFEVKYENFVKDPMMYAENLYLQFGLELTDDTRARMNNFLADFKEHESSQYDVPEQVIKMVNTKFQDYLNECGYEVRQGSGT